jgi:hypothetical protein
MLHTPVVEGDVKMTVNYTQILMKSGKNIGWFVRQPYSNYMLKPNSQCYGWSLIYQKLVLCSRKSMHPAVIILSVLWS